MTDEQKEELRTLEDTRRDYDKSLEALLAKQKEYAAIDAKYAKQKEQTQLWQTKTAQAEHRAADLAEQLRIAEAEIAKLKAKLREA